MIELKHILHPTDFSPAADQALDYACTLARLFGAELHLLYVLPEHLPVAPAQDLDVPPWEDYLEGLRKSAEVHLARRPAPDQAPETSIRRVTRSGPPVPEIVQYARQNGIALIVMGTHGRTGLSHALIGSVAEKLVRRAPCPVLTVHPAES